MTKENFNGYQLFDGRLVAIATMHEKDKVIAPILEKELGLKCITIPDFNTDVFGTFSGEVERVHSPLETVRSKALAALELCNADLVIASEGSFGPHPSSFFIPTNEEFIIFIDKKNALEIIGRHLTFKTNFKELPITSIEDLTDFLSIIGFPEHGIILKIKDEINTNDFVFKDLKSQIELEILVLNSLEKNQIITAQSDMRAMFNPTRMLAIEQATNDLIKNIKSTYPNCQVPGFSINEVLIGLPCKLCKEPTKSPKAYSYKCNKCDFKEVRQVKDNNYEDPMYCDFCNP